MELSMTSSQVPFEEGNLESPSENPSTNPTLFDFHRCAFLPKIKKLQREIDKYMASSSFSEARKHLLATFQDTIIKHANNKIEAGCFLHTHITKNREKSDMFCQSTFNREYWKLADDINTETLKKNYLAQAIGPAKQEVLLSKLLEIPTSPAHFTESQIGVDNVVVTWTVHEQGSVSYEIKIVRQDVKANLIQTRTVTCSQPPVTLSSLTPNTCYHLQVRACGLEYKGMYSQPLTITTLAGQPGKPEKPKIEVESPSRAKVIIERLSFEDLHGADHVDSVVLEATFQEDMEWDQISIAERDKPHSIPITEHITLPRVPSHCDSIYYRVRMTTIGGESVSDVEELSILRFIPGPPIDPKCSDHDPEERRAVISWSPPLRNQRSIKLYDIKYQQDNTNWKPYKEPPDGTCTSVMFSNLSPAANYSIKLRACNYELVYGEYAILKFKTKPAKPARPNIPNIHLDTENISIAHVYVTRLSEEDENGSPISSIIVQKAVGEISNWTDEICDFPKGDRPIKLTVNLFNATEKKKHYFRVIMVNEAGKSEPSPYCEMEYSQLIPGELSNVCADHITNNSITLKWDPPPCNPISVDYYTVEMQEDGQKEWKRLSAPRDNILRKYKMFTAPNLHQNCTYNFRVIAYNKDNECARSNEEDIVSAATQPCPPTKPDVSNIKVDILDSSTAKICVQKPSIDETGSDITSLIVKRRSEKDELLSDEEINCEDCKGKMIVKTIAINPQVCYLRICLRNEHGMSPESEPVGVSAYDITPGPPILHEVKGEDIGVKSISLTWNRPKDRGQAAKQYRIEMKHEQSQLWTAVPYLYTVNEFEHRGDISNLIPKTKYVFRIYALNGDLKSVSSEEITTETRAGRPDKPQPPKLSQLDRDPSKARVIFSRLDQTKENGSPVSSIKMEYKHEKLHWSLVGNDNKKLNSEMSIFDIDLPNIEEKEIQWLSFRMKMINGEGESEPSEDVPIRVSDLQPGIVEDLEVVKTAYHHVTLTWKTPKTHPAIIVNYVIEIKEVESDGWKDCIKLDPDKTEYQIKNLQCSHEYHFRVSAVSRSTKGPYQEIKVATPDLPPQPPLQLRADKKWSDAVKVRWRKPAGDPQTNDAYRIAVKDRKGIKEIKRYYTRGYSKTIKDLTSYTTYKVEVAGVSKSMKFSTENPSIDVTTAVSDAARVAWTVVGSVTLGPLGGYAAHQGLKSDDKSHCIDSDTECEVEFVEECEKMYRQTQRGRKSKQTAQQTAQKDRMTEPALTREISTRTTKQVSSASSGACGSSIKQLPATNDVRKTDLIQTKHCDTETKQKLQHHTRGDKLKRDNPSRKKVPKPTSEISKV